MVKQCIGIDLGGSFIKFGLLDAEGKRSKAIDLPTPQQGGQAVVEQMIHGAKQLMHIHGLARKDIAAIGVGSPGPLSMSKGIILETPNIPGLRNVPIRDHISESLQVPSILENDANAAGFGEYLEVRKSGISDMVFLTLGTGVGGGVVIGGKVLHGAHEIGAELGHVIVQPGGERCNCGQLGCLERYSSATFMGLRAVKFIEAGRQSTLCETLKFKGKLTSKDVNDARKNGDALAAEVWDDAARCLGIACVTIARMLDPDLIIFGGGMANSGRDILDPVEKYFHQMHWKITEPFTRLALAKLGNDAGFVGAAGVAWQAYNDGSLK